MRRLLASGVISLMALVAGISILTTGSVPTVVQSAEKKNLSPAPGKPTTLTGSDTAVVFGPVCYEHPGPDNSWAFFSDYFNVTDTRGRRYLIEVSWGSGARRASVAGVEVLGQNDAGTVSVAEVSPGSNGVSIGFRGFTGDPFTVRVVHVPDPTYVVYPRTKFSRMPSIDTVSAYFTVDVNNAAPTGLLHILNGTTTSNRVTSGKVWLNGSIVASGSDFASGKATVSKNVTLLSSNQFDVLNQSADSSSLMLVTFRATDDTPPAVTMSWPPTPFLTDSSAITLIGTVVDQTPCSLSVYEGAWSAVDAGFVTSFALPSDGPYTARVTVRNSADLATTTDLSTTVTRSIVRDTQAPVLTVIRPLAADTTVTDSSLIIAGWWDDLTPTTVSVDDDTIGADTSGTIAESYPLDIGSNRILLRARDALGHVTSITKRVFRTLSGEPTAPDSTFAVPALPDTSFTSFYESVAFIVENEPPLQQDFVPESLTTSLAAVVRGRVLGRDFGPLGNVRVSVLGHPGYGYAITRKDGRYDLLVNGGYPLTLRFTKLGFLEAQRRVEPGPEDFALIPDVAMVGRTQRVTTVDTTSAYLAFGRFANDANGDRKLKLFFPQGTLAQAQGSVGMQTFYEYNVRATEFTVGGDGEEAMPAQLPPGSAYTYCVELSTDEADEIGNANGDQIPSTQFSKPVSLFVRNFLSFPVGAYVPVGSYDRVAGRWVQEQNAQVIKIVGVDSSRADIDLTGDGAAETDSVLAYLGYSAAERTQLAAQYAVGDTVWRTTIQHFTTVDFNSNLDMVAAEITGGVAGQPLDDVPDYCPAQGSIIECENRVLGQRIPVVGTPYTLNYRSSRTPGDVASRTLRVITPDEVKDNVAAILLEVEVMGQVLRDSLSRAEDGNLENQAIEVTWNGRDVYGRRVNRAVDARMSIGFRRAAQYGRTMVSGRSFGDGTSTTGSMDGATGDRAVGQVRWFRQKVSVGAPSMGSAALGGWSISPHHYYDLAGRGTLYYGDGTVRRDLNYPLIWAFAGTGNHQNLSPQDLAVAPDGSVYAADSWGGQIERIAPNGTRTVVAGTGAAGDFSSGTYLGDTTSTATGTPLKWPTGLALGPDGSLYFTMGGETDAFNATRVCRLTPQGRIQTIAGNGNHTGSGTGDGGSALSATFSSLTGIALGPDGSVFVGDGNDKVVRRIWPNGTITRWAGGGASPGAAGPATSFSLGGVTDLAVDDQGNLYIAEGSARRIRRVGPDGQMMVFATYPSDSNVFWPGSIALTPDGSMYIGSLTGKRVFRRDPDGTVSVFGGNGGSGGSAGDGRSVFDTDLGETAGIAMGPQGEIYLGQTGATGYSSHFIRVIRPDIPTAHGNEIRIPSEDGTELYAFNRATGQLLNTRDALTGAVLYDFRYSAGRLHSIIDANGDTTTIERSGETPTAIIAPRGQVTTLGTDGNGWLDGIENPNSESFTFVYADSGLMQSMTDPRTYEHTFSYDDSTGRLAEDHDPAGGSQTLTASKAGNTRTTRRTTGENLETVYQVTDHFNGTRHRSIDPPDRAAVLEVDNTDATVSVSNPDGSTSFTRLAASGRFGMKAPDARLVRDVLPVSEIAREIEVETTDSGFDPPDTTTDWTQRVWINRDTRPDPFETTYHADTREIIATTPEGRTITTTIDAVGRLTSMTIGDLDREDFSYDGHGRLSGYRQGERSWTFSHDDSGRVASIQDTLGRTTLLRYDPADRLIRQTRPDNQSIGFHYDAGGNLTGLTPPGKPTHVFDHTEVDLVSEYTPPLSGATTYDYDLDRRLEAVNRPDSLDITLEYEGGTGRLDRIVHLRGMNDFSYNSTTGYVDSVSSPDTVTVSYGYDGPLVTSETWSGRVNGTVEWIYNNDFQVASQIVGDHTVAYDYDDDGLLTELSCDEGTLTLTRRPTDGLIWGTSLGGVTTVTDYNSHGELKLEATLFGGDTLYRTRYDRDPLGRITAWHEREGSTLRSRQFAYDSTGRLKQVWDSLADTLIESYGYDLNGNRLTVAHPADTVVATFDGEDRLLTHGSASYGYTRSGFMARAVSGSDTTRYNYDAPGNLVRVQTPSATVNYRVDGLNRRVERKLNGTVTNRWIWEDRLRIAGEVDGTGVVLKRYVYGTKINVPDFVVTSDTAYRVVADHLGSVRLVVNVETGAIVERNEYDAWGIESGTTRTGLVPMGFAGGLMDETTAMVRFGLRDYNAASGRWTAADPIGFVGGDPNLFAYSTVEPINAIDPFGLSRDNYEADWKRHGGPHVDRYRDGKRPPIGRYQLDGTPLGNSPPIPRKDWERFAEAAKKAAEMWRRWKSSSLVTRTGCSRVGWFVINEALYPGVLNENEWDPAVQPPLPFHPQDSPFQRLPVRPR